MNLPLAIWWGSVSLAAVSTFAMLSLIVSRAFRNRRALIEQARRNHLKQVAFELLEEPERLFDLKTTLRPTDRRLLHNLFTELLQQVHGDYAERFVSLMRILGLVEECLGRLDHRRWEYRAEACKVLGAFNDPNVRLALYRALDDRVPDVRVEAARALVRLGAVRSVTDLIQYLVTDDTTPSLAVMDLFRKLGLAAVPELLGLVENDPRLAVKLLAIDALGYSRDLRAVPVLLHFYDHPSQTLRLAVMQALGRLRDPRALPAVLLAMTDLNWEVRSQAVNCAGRLGSPDAIPLLERLLGDDEWWVRYHAAEALHQLGRRGISVLERAATQPNPAAAEMAWGILREKGLAA